jgi:hypothetical protein
MRQSPSADPVFGSGASRVAATGHEPANLGDILERVLDRGIVIVGDIRVSLLDIELLTLKLRLVVASVDTARQMGIDWWEHDPWLTSKAREALPQEAQPAALSSASSSRSPSASDSASRSPAPRDSGSRSRRSEVDDA